ncbi:MAG: PrsW family glutamic-type intramembrane protease [Patescibacteria group bacterium]
MVFPISVLVLSLLPGFVWLTFFWEEEDAHPEPRNLIALVFISGMISAIIVALVGKAITEYYFATIAEPSFLYILITASLEEIGKFLFIALFVSRLRAFDEPVDAMVYMVVGALGFATLENIAYLSKEAEVSNMLGNVAQIASLRFVGSTLLHALCSGTLGYFWALSIRHFRHPSYLILGVTLAITLHTYFNYLIITYGSMFFVLPLLLVSGFFVLSDFEELRWRSV